MLPPTSVLVVTVWVEFQLNTLFLFLHALILTESRIETGGRSAVDSAQIVKIPMFRLELSPYKHIIPHKP